MYLALTVGVIHLSLPVLFRYFLFFLFFYTCEINKNDNLSEGIYYMQVRERKDNEGFFFYLTHSFSVLFIFIFIFIYIYFFLPSLYFENSIIH